MLRTESPLRREVTNRYLVFVTVLMFAGFSHAANAGLSVSPSPSTGSYTVSWTAVPGADEYRLRESTNGGVTWSGNYYVWGTAKSFAGKPIGTYTYKLRYCVEIYMRGEYFPRCYDATYPTVSVTVQPAGPATPTGLSGPSTDDDGAYSIIWNAVSGATHYTIERQTDGGGWSFATDVITTSYDESGLVSGIHDYRVKACNASTCSGYSSTTTVTVTIQGPPPPPPPVPGTNGDPGVSRESDQTGTIAGTFRVDESGAATYSIPIVTAAGTAGVAPEISLNYSSSGGNGIAGMGWSVGGMSAITRCKQTYDQDRNPLPITWSSSDRYCLDGQRLLLENPAQSYGAANTTYRTEIDSGAIVTIRGSSNGEPDYFEVRRKDGSTSYYGKSPGDTSNTSAKSGGGAGKTFIWALRHFRDNIGNPIWFDYYNDSAGQRVRTIYWAFGTGRGPVSGHGARLEFHYIDRDDDRLGYVAGVALKTQKLLSEIRSYNVVGSASLIRSYNLYYDEQTTTNDKVSRLTSIKECVGDTCLPKTEFRWNLPANYTYLAQLSSMNLAESNNLSDLTLADINGDGMMDLVWLEGQPANAVFNYATSNGTSLSQRPFSNGNLEYSPSGSAEKLTPIDFNLDGRDDIAYWDDNANRWKVLISAPQNDRSWRLKTSIYLTPIDDEDVTFVDIDSNGTTDAVWATGTGNKQLKLSRLTKRPNQQPGSSIYYHFDTPVNVGSPSSSTTGELHAVAADLNGDGRIGLVVGRDAPFCEYEFNPPLCFGPKYANLLNITNPMSATPGYATYANLNNTGALWSNEHVVPSGILASDVNADGLSDFFYPVYRDPNDNINQWHLAINRGNGSFDVTQHYETTMSKSGARRPQFVDWNGDNFPDLMWKSTADGGSVFVRYWNPSTNRLDPRTSATSVVNTSNNESVFFPDMNGDGVPDMMKVDTSSGAGNIKIYTRKTGYTVANRAANRIQEIENGLGAVTTVTFEPLSYSDHYERLQVDTDQNAPGGGPVHCILVGETAIEDVCVNRSVWEVTAEGFYEQINGDWDLPGSMPSLKKTSPVIEVSGPMYVVTNVAGTAPAGSLLTPGAFNAAATSSIEYHYYEARVQAAGRGFLGFEQLKTVDTISNVSTTTQYRQDWPFTGLPIGTVVSTAAGHILGGGSTTWEVLQWDAASRAVAEANGTANLGPINVELTINRENSYELVSNGAAPGALLSTTLTTTQFDAEANARTVAVTTTNELTGQDDLIVTTTNVFESATFDLWEGRLKSTTVVSDRPSFAGTARRNASFEYYTSGTYRGMLHKEIKEPGHPDFELTTTHHYDAYGNRKKVTVGDGTTTRCSAPAATAVYESSGRYVDYNYDCLGRLTTHVVSRNAYGQPTRVDTILDANNTNSRLTTNVYYGALGREYYRSAEDGSFQTTYLTPSTGNCPAGSAYKATTYTAGGGTSEICFDALARETRKLTLGFDGEWDAQDTIFDAKGRVLHKSEPFDLSGGAAYWTTQEYDLLDRPTKTTLPDNTWSDVAYNRFDTQTTISYQNQRRIEKKNALGDLIESTDNIGGTSRFTYDNLGNLRTSTDAAGNITTTVHNDIGQKKLLHLPDSRSNAGTWTYEYNHFGELKKQTNPNGHTSEMTYDAAGRMRSRIDRINGSSIEASATWIYDSSPNGLGKIDSVSDAYSGYAQTTLYDSLGRNDEVVTNFDGGVYFEKTTYDEFGRVHQYFDAAGNGSFTDHGIVSQYGYFGHLAGIADAVEVGGAPRTIYRRISAMNARGQVTDEELGVGASGVPAITASYLFEPDTGRLADKDAYNAAGEQVQDLHYVWNDVGSLTSRSDTYHGAGAPNMLSETFGYDGLNRLTSHGENGQAALSVTYDAVGNIKTKTGVSGTYQYGTNASPYSVTYANGSNYYYDLSGNNTSGGGRTIVYSTFDKPVSISKGGNSVTFAYSPDRSRFRRVDSGASTKTTRYIGNVEFIDHHNGNVERKRYIGGVAIETGYYTNGNETRRDTEYTLHDHLGSLDIITDDAGEVLQKLSFGPWGQRRDASNWKETNSSNQLIDLGPTFDVSKTTKGFTGHEMVDSVGIIHMNGRIYDPFLGRFLQADNLVQDPANTQSHNRYSYVWNNPLNATDPSGEFIFTLTAMFIVAFETFKWYAIAAIFAVAGTLDALIAGADLSDAFLSGIISGISAGAFAGVGNVLTSKLAGNFAAGLSGVGFAVKVISHGLIGGITSVLRGGKFGHGFASAFFTAAATSFNNSQFIGKAGYSWKRVMIGATIGGSASRLSGGKFANGAITGAFSQALNQERGEHARWQENAAREMAEVEWQKVASIEFNVGMAADSPQIGELGKLTFGLSANGEELAYEFAVDGKVLSVGVATGFDGEITVEVSRGIGWEDVASIAAGGSLSTNLDVGFFADVRMGMFAGDVTMYIHNKSIWHDITSWFKAINNSIRTTMNQMLMDMAPSNP